MYGTSSGRDRALYIGVTTAMISCLVCRLEGCTVVSAGAWSIWAIRHDQLLLRNCRYILLLAVDTYEVTLLRHPSHV